MRQKEFFNVKTCFKQRKSLYLYHCEYLVCFWQKMEQFSEEILNFSCPSTTEGFQILYSSTFQSTVSTFYGATFRFSYILYLLRFILFLKTNMDLSSYEQMGQQLFSESKSLKEQFGSMILKMFMQFFCQVFIFFLN